MFVDQSRANHDCGNAICMVLWVQCCGCDFSPMQLNVIDCCRQRSIATQFIQSIGRTFLDEVKIKSNRFHCFFSFLCGVCVCAFELPSVCQCGRVIHTLAHAWYRGRSVLLCRKPRMKNYQVAICMGEVQPTRKRIRARCEMNGNDEEEWATLAAAKARAQLQENSLKTF